MNKWNLSVVFGNRLFFTSKNNVQRFCSNTDHDTRLRQERPYKSKSEQEILLAATTTTTTTTLMMMMMMMTWRQVVFAVERGKYTGESWSRCCCFCCFVSLLMLVVFSGCAKKYVSSLIDQLIFIEVYRNSTNSNLFLACALNRWMCNDHKHTNTIIILQQNVYKVNASDALGGKTENFTS